MANHPVGGTLAPNDIMGLLERTQQRAPQGRSSGPGVLIPVPPERKLELGLDPSDQIFMLRPGTKMEQGLFDEAKKRGFTAFRKDVDRGDGDAVPRVFFKKKLDVKGQGGAF